MEDELVDVAAPNCPHCRHPMDVLGTSWWCLDCTESLPFVA